MLNCLQYLRAFGNLRILNMQGNPCSRDPDYHTRVIAHLAQSDNQPKSPHLSDLVYVDYRLVDPEKVQLAKEQWQDELYEEQEKENNGGDGGLVSVQTQRDRPKLREVKAMLKSAAGVAGGRVFNTPTDG